jgi:NitT/TauT family transport system permease protein
MAAATGGVALATPKYRLGGTVITVAWVAVLLVVWSFGTRFSLPSLSEIPGAWLTLLKEEGLLYELGVSMRLNLEVILISTVLSLIFAYLTVDRRFRPPVHMLAKCRFFGMAGFVIIFTRVFGGGHALKVSMLVFIMVTFYVTSMIDIVESTTSDEYDHARSLRMSRWRSVWEVVVLGKLDQTFDALRQNAAIGWMSLTMVEGLVRFEGGVGVIMLNESKYRNLAAVFAVQLTVLAIGILQDQILGWLKNVVCPHAALVLEHK